MKKSAHLILLTFSLHCELSPIVYDDMYYFWIMGLGYPESSQTATNTMCWAYLEIARHIIASWGFQTATKSQTLAISLSANCNLCKVSIFKRQPGISTVGQAHQYSLFYPQPVDKNNDGCIKEVTTEQWALKTLYREESTKLLFHPNLDSYTDESTS